MREPIAVPGFENCFAVDIKLSGQIWLTGVISGDKKRDIPPNPELGVPALLSRSVVDAEGKPIKTLEEWEDWGQFHLNECGQLFQQCNRINSSPEDAKKK